LEESILEPDQFQLNFLPERKIFKISELSRHVRERLEANFSNIWVEGQISNFSRAASGHLYFTLKDESAQLRCICFRQQARLLKFRPEDGLEIIVRGSISVYERRGEYQLVAEHLEPLGVGALQLAFEQLKKKLAAEGLFDAAGKKSLPRFPRRIGIITSPTGAVIQDMIRVLERRHKNLHLLVYPVRVQGDGAAGEMVEALRVFNDVPPKGVPVDVIIIGRGGGSLEDLWAFNEETLARAIAGSQVPILSAVGHETDFTIADFVADLRAPTPSAAAELVIETQQQVEKQITTMQESLRREMQYRLLDCQKRLTELIARRGFQNLRMVVAQAAQRSDDAAARLMESAHAALRLLRHRWEEQDTFLRHFDLRGRQERLRLLWSRHTVNLVHGMQLHIVEKRGLLDPLQAQLEQLSPKKILERGYAIVKDSSGNALRRAADTSAGETITVQLGIGHLEADVKKVIPKQS
jgi:exodeoxyribonuclease VII large subunit